MKHIVKIGYGVMDLSGVLIVFLFYSIQHYMMAFNKPFITFQTSLKKIQLFIKATATVEIIIFPMLVISHGSLPLHFLWVLSFSSCHSQLSIFQLSLQRVCIQRVSASSQYLVNPEKSPSGPILTVRYKNSHPERLQNMVPL